MAEIEKDELETDKVSSLPFEFNENCIVISNRTEGSFYDKNLSTILQGNNQLLYKHLDCI